MASFVARVDRENLGRNLFWGLRHVSHVLGRMAGLDDLHSPKNNCTSRVRGAGCQGAMNVLSFNAKCRSFRMFEASYDEQFRPLPHGRKSQLHRINAAEGNALLPGLFTRFCRAMLC